MNEAGQKVQGFEPGALETGAADAVLNALPHPVLLVAEDGAIHFANDAAEAFFKAGAAVLRRQPLSEFVPFGSPLLALVEQVRERGAPVNASTSARRATAPSASSTFRSRPCRSGLKRCW